MIDLNKLENVIKLDTLLNQKARLFENEQDWESYLKNQGIIIKCEGGRIERPENTMQMWNAFWNIKKKRLVRDRKYLIIPRDFAEKALILLILP